MPLREFLDSYQKWKMIKKQNKLLLALSGVFVFAALVILADLVLPGKIVTDEILDIKRERQQYYNAAGNYHYSYKVITAKHHFWVSENFAELIQENQKIEYSISRIFKEVNWYRLLTSENREIYSLRILSGFVIPLTLIIVIGLGFKYEEKISVLVFVIQVLVIADLIFLII